MPKIIELTGQRFGKLVVLRRDGSYNGNSKWLCRCDCGKTKSINGIYLREGETKSCGCLQIELSKRKKKPFYKKDLKGTCFGKLTVLEFAGREKGRIVWKCLCDCGNTKNVRSDLLKEGRIKSCGCSHKRKGVPKKKGGRYKFLT